MNLNDKNVTACPPVVADQGLRKISEAKTALHPNLRPLFQTLRS